LNMMAPSTGGADPGIANQGPAGSDGEE
jgi:hypothetical protein